MARPQLWRDSAGNWYTGEFGTIPISPDEAAQLIEDQPGLHEARWLLYGLIVALPLCIAAWVQS